MLFHLLTIHPPLVNSPLQESILGRAREQGLIDVRVVNIRDFAAGRHQVTDDYPYGGGAGMVMKPEPIAGAVRQAMAEGEARRGGKAARVILTDPQGDTFTQAKAQELSQEPHLIFICGRYEGIDERVRSICTDALSIGDYVLTGGELPALVMIDAVSRLLPGVLGDATSPVTDSFAASGILEGPQYTRPPEFEGMRVPEVLLKGNHQEVERWRRKEALRRTKLRRPDLLEQVQLSKEDYDLLDEIWWEEAGRNTGE